LGITLLSFIGFGIDYYLKSKSMDINDDTKKHKLSKNMNLELENIMIRWKKDNIDKQNNYDLFIKDCFPEHINQNENEYILDASIKNSIWVKLFNKTNDSQALHKIETIT
jgi:hypothetical protein